MRIMMMDGGLVLGIISVSQEEEFLSVCLH